MAAYNFARRLKTLSGLTLYEYVAKIWTSEPDRFIVDPFHQMPGLGLGLIGHSQKMTVAASATAEKKTVGHRS